MNSSLPLAHHDHARPAVSVVTGAGNAQHAQSQKGITVELQCQMLTRAPCQESCCEQLQPPDVCHDQPFSEHIGCNGKDGQSEDKSTGEQAFELRPESAAQANGGTGQAKDKNHDSQPEEQATYEQRTPADLISGVDVTVEDASMTSPCNCGVLQQASIAVPVLRPPPLSAEETVISDETPQAATQQQQQVSPAEGGRRSSLGRILQATNKVSVSRLTRNASGAVAGRTEQAQCAQRRRLAEEAAWQWELERSTADSPPSRRRADSSLMRQNSSELDGSQGAALGLASMLQVRDCLDCVIMVTVSISLGQMVTACR